MKEKIYVRNYGGLLTLEGDNRLMGGSISPMHSLKDAFQGGRGTGGFMTLEGLKIGRNIFLRTPANFPSVDERGVCELFGSTLNGPSGVTISKGVTQPLGETHQLIAINNRYQTLQANRKSTEKVD